MLRQARGAAALTQEELAERAQVTDRGIRYLERGQRRPNRHTVERLSVCPPTNGPSSLPRPVLSSPKPKEEPESYARRRIRWLAESTTSAAFANG